MPFPRLLEECSGSAVYVASSPELDGISGRFFLRRRERRTKRITYDADVAARLWSVSEKLCASQVTSSPRSGRRYPLE